MRGMASKARRRDPGPAPQPGAVLRQPDSGPGGASSRDCNRAFASRARSMWRPHICKISFLSVGRSVMRKPTSPVKASSTAWTATSISRRVCASIAHIPPAGCSERPTCPGKSREVPTVVSGLDRPRSLIVRLFYCSILAPEVGPVNECDQIARYRAFPRDKAAPRRYIAARRDRPSSPRELKCRN